MKMKAVVNWTTLLCASLVLLMQQKFLEVQKKEKEGERSSCRCWTVCFRSEVK